MRLRGMGVNIATPGALLNPLMIVPKPAGEVAPPDAPAPPQSPSSTSTDHVGDIDANGRLIGVDGIMDQIGEALRRQVEPLVQNTVLPVLQRDVALQRELGGAAGHEMAAELKPWVIVGALALATIAVVKVRKSYRRSR